MPPKKQRAKVRHDELKLEVTGILLFALAIFVFVSLFQQMGIVGSFIVKFLTVLTGKKGAFVIPCLLALYGVNLCLRRRLALPGVFLFFFISLAMVHQATLSSNKHILGMWQLGVQGEGGGILGAAFTIFVVSLFGDLGSKILLATLCCLTLIYLTGVPLSKFLKDFWQWFRKSAGNLKERVLDFLFVEEEFEPTKTEEQGKRPKSSHSIPLIIDHSASRSFPELPDEEEDFALPEAEGDKEKLHQEPEPPPSSQGNYDLPPLDLLAKPLKVKSSRLNKEILENVRILEETLESFGVKVCVSQVHRGPAITRYEIQPSPGVKVSKIVHLADDIALSLAAADVRIEAPIPGKAALGIEVPNKEITPVYLREILESNEFQNASSKLTIALGKDITGNPIVADLVKMPHLLIAGATGSGKSVCLNAIICSILYKARPGEVKFLLIDPKMVELTTYNEIPHLVAPVVIDPRKAASALKWLIKEMEDRYELFASLGVRDLIRYNSLVSEEDQTQLQPLPYIVVVIDELADLMMIAPVDVEDAICRLAQMARAAGIHLVVATQRPSVDVITGVIKANIPSRIAFAVSSQVDSRTILDMNGAEKLLGRGDMLFLPTGAIKPLRIQGAYVSEEEVEKIVSFIKKQGETSYVSEFPEVEEASSEPEKEFGDPLFADAAKVVIEAGHASVSLLQRRLRVGYARAARLMDILEEKGIVGPYEGAKPRQVLMTAEQFQRYYGK